MSHRNPSRWLKLYACGCAIHDLSPAMYRDPCPEHGSPIMEAGYYQEDEVGDAVRRVRREYAEALATETT